MLRTAIVLLTPVALLFASPALAQNNPPVVSNVTASQSDPCGVVAIGYDLADADGDSCIVRVAISQDGGTTWNVPSLNLTGDVGNGITPGVGKSITWDVSLDIPGLSGSAFRIRVYADDQQGAGPNMVYVPPGSFFMGGGGYWLVHAVSLSGFWIGRCEVTNTEYAVFLNAGGNDDHWDGSQKISRAPNGDGGYVYSVVSGSEQHPVTYVNYEDASAYCVWLSGVTGGSYRLPTEAEWEMAAAWDPMVQVHWKFACQSDSINGDEANFHGGGDPWDSGPYPRTTPVGFYDGSLQLKAVWNWPSETTEYQTQDAKSFWGCRDLSGNVHEWCYDWYSDPYYYDYVAAGSPADPTGPTSGTNRIVRGGCWGDAPAQYPSYERYQKEPTSRNAYVGFRCAAGVP